MHQSQTDPPKNDRFLVCIKVYFSSLEQGMSHVSSEKFAPPYNPASRVEVLPKERPIAMQLERILLY